MSRNSGTRGFPSDDHNKPHLLFVRGRLMSYDYRGRQLAEALEKRGWSIEYVDPPVDKVLPGQIAVFVKNVPGTRKDMLKAREKKGKLVLLLEDHLALHGLVHWDLWDSIVFPNKLCKEIFQNKVRDGVQTWWIPHHIDNRHKKSVATEARIAYVGNKKTCLYLSEMTNECDVELIFEPRMWFEKSREFNVFVNIRQPEKADFKPAPKVAMAVACNGVLVTTPDAAVTELLGDDYPYYVQPEWLQVKKTLGAVRRDFGGETWQKALGILASCRPLLDLEKQLPQYERIFQQCQT